MKGLHAVVKAVSYAVYFIFGILVVPLWIFGTVEVFCMFAFEDEWHVVWALFLVTDRISK